MALGTFSIHDGLCSCYIQVDALDKEFVLACSRLVLLAAYHSFQV